MLLKDTGELERLALLVGCFSGGDDLLEAGTLTEQVHRRDCRSQPAEAVYTIIYKVEMTQASRA